MRGKTDDVLIYCLLIFSSIHFPLAREDQLWTSRALSCSCFNPLPSCEGRRSAYQISRQPSALQSTSLLRGKTGHSSRRVDSNVASIHFPLAREDNLFRVHFLFQFCFNPLPSCEGRLIRIYSISDTVLLQSTSLLRGKTSSNSSITFSLLLQSTSLLRGKTARCPGLFGILRASIHFPLAREDFYFRQ